MTVFEKGTYLTVGDLRKELETYDDDTAVCLNGFARGPLVTLSPGYITSVPSVTLHFAYVSDKIAGA